MDKHTEYELLRYKVFFQRNYEVIIEEDKMCSQNYYNYDLRSD